MTVRDVIKILILSPVYFRLDLLARKHLIQEFLQLYGKSLDEGRGISPSLD